MFYVALQANAVQLSPELRDLLDKIFVADELKRITVQVCLLPAFNMCMHCH